METKNTQKNAGNNMPLQIWQNPQITEIEIAGGPTPSTVEDAGYNS